MVSQQQRIPSKTAMTQSKRFRPALRLLCIALLGLALATDGRTSATQSPHDSAAGQTPVWMVVKTGGCEPGIVEDMLNGWLESTREYEFESDLAAAAFDEVVKLVNVARDLAQDLCV